MAQTDMYEEVRIFESGKNVYVARSDANKFLSLCQKREIGILGFEGLYCKNGSVTPDLSLIADFSSICKNDDFIQQSLNSAMKVLSSFPVDNDLYIDFVLTDQKSNKRK